MPVFLRLSTIFYKQKSGELPLLDENNKAVSNSYILARFMPDGKKTVLILQRVNKQRSKNHHRYFLL
jgi:hypothetical protein